MKKDQNSGYEKTKTPSAKTPSAKMKDGSSLLGSGMARKAAETLKGRKSRIDEVINGYTR